MPVTTDQAAGQAIGWREQLRSFHLTGQWLEGFRDIPVPLVEPDERMSVLPETCGRILFDARIEARSDFLALLTRQKARLEEVLLMDTSHAPESISAETLASSLGAEGDQFLDSAALARALRRPKRPPVMAEQRRSLLISAQMTLRNYLEAAQNSPPFHVIADAEDPFLAALGFDEAQLATMTTVQRALRIAQLECDMRVDASTQREHLDRISWRAARPADLLAMPPVLAIDSASKASSIHLASLSRLIRSGRPVLALVLGDGADFASFDFGYQCLGFREVCVLQSSLHHWEHAAEALGAIAVQPRPSVVFLDTSGAPAAERLFESRAFPHFFYNPLLGETWKHRFRLLAPGESAVTAAHAAVCASAWRKHFRVIPPAAWDDEQLEISEYLSRYGADPPLAVPFLATDGPDGAAVRLALTRDLADACKDRLRAWRLLEELAGIRNSYVESAAAQMREEMESIPRSEEAALVERVKIETVQKLVAVLMSSEPLPAGGLSTMLLPPMPALPGVAAAPAAAPAPVASAAAPAAAPAPEAEAEASEEPYIDSFLCTSCNDCMKVNKLVFQYDSNKQAYIADAKAGTFAELVRAAEGCPAKCIHPGKPRPGDTSATPDILARAAKLG